MPLDHLAKGLDHVQRPDPLVLQGGTSGVAEAQPTDHHVELAAGHLGQPEPGQSDLGHREDARHEVRVTEDHLVDVDLQRGLEPASHADVTHRRGAPVDLLEAGAHGSCLIAAPYSRRVAAWLNRRARSRSPRRSTSTSSPTAPRPTPHTRRCGPTPRPWPPPPQACRSGQTSTPSCGSRSEEHTSELQSLMRISYAVFCL